MEDKMLTSVDELGIPGFKWSSGKVRDWTDVGLNLRLVVSTDRASAFDVVLPDGIPGKGRVLNQLSIFWREFLGKRFPNLRNDLIDSGDASCLAYLGILTPEQKEALKGRMMLVRKALVIPIEAVVRGYASGSIWEEYVRVRGRRASFRGVQVWDHHLPPDLEESGKLFEPIFTPTTKAPQGEHDTSLRFLEMERYIDGWLKRNPKIQGKTDKKILSEAIRSTSLGLYRKAREHALNRNIVIADTKFEFGIDPITGELCLIDEVLTPDSSRFWDARSYEPGHSQSSFDKQPVRDWLAASGWDKRPPAPVLPQGVVQAMTERYRQAFTILTGRKL